MATPEGPVGHARLQAQFGREPLPAQRELRDPFIAYLHKIGEVPLLTKEDEYELGTKVQKGLKAHDTLQSAQPLPPKEKLRLRQEVQEGRGAHEHFVLANLRLVVAFAKRYYVPLDRRDDLIQAGNEGLMHAAHKFNPDKGFKFSTYAAWWIRKEIQKHLDYSGNGPTILNRRKNMVLYRSLHDTIDNLREDLKREPTIEEIGEVTELSAKRVVEILSMPLYATPLETSGSEDRDPEQQIAAPPTSEEEEMEEAQEREYILSLIHATVLSSRQRKVLILMLENMTYGEIGQEIGKMKADRPISKQRAEQIAKSASAKVAEYYRQTLDSPLEG